MFNNVGLKIKALAEAILGVTLASSGMLFLVAFIAILTGEYENIHLIYNLPIYDIYFLKRILEVMEKWVILVLFAENHLLNRNLPINIQSRVSQQNTTIRFWMI